MNEHIKFYNYLVDRMIFECFPGVSFVSVYSFLDRNGLLDSKLTRNNDDIHLGKRGIAQYVSMMKTCVFNKLKSRKYPKQPQETNLSRGPAEDP